MKVLNDILEMKLEDLQAAMKESIYQEGMNKAVRMIKEKVTPNISGNRAQRRVAKSLARKREVA